MVTKIGDQILLDNLKLGAINNPDDPETVYMAFTDVDNEETYTVPIAVNKLDQYFTLLKQTAAGQRIEVAGADQMPRGGPQG